MFRNNLRFLSLASIVLILGASSADSETLQSLIGDQDSFGTDLPESVLLSNNQIVAAQQDPGDGDTDKWCLSEFSWRHEYPLPPHGTVEYDVGIHVAIDIKPGSDPNCFNNNGHGVIPVAILGAADFDVTQVDLESLLFDGLEVRVRGNRGPLCSFEESNADTYLDLVCHFDDEPDNWVPGDTTATLVGTLLDGTPFVGTDSICIRP